MQSIGYRRRAIVSASVAILAFSALFAAPAMAADMAPRPAPVYRPPPPVVPVVPVVSPPPLSSLLQAAPTIASTATSATIANNRRFILSPPSGWTPQRRAILSPTTTAMPTYEASARPSVTPDGSPCAMVLDLPPGAPEPCWRHTMAQFPGPRNKTDRRARRRRDGRANARRQRLLRRFGVLGYPACRALRSAHWSIRRSSQQTRSATSAEPTRPSGSPVSGGAEGSRPRRFGVTTSVRCSNGSTSRGLCPVPSSRP